MCAKFNRYIGRSQSTAERSEEEDISPKTQKQALGVTDKRVEVSKYRIRGRFHNILEHKRHFGRCKAEM